MDKCKLVDSRVRVCANEHVLNRDHGSNEKLKGGTDDVSEETWENPTPFPIPNSIYLFLFPLQSKCLMSLMKRRPEQALHFCRVTTIDTSDKSVRWLYGGTFAIQDLDDNVATVKL